MSTLRKILAVFAAMLFGYAVGAVAQSSVAVTATVTGANSAPYEYGSYWVSLVDSNGVVVQSSGTITPQVLSGSLSSTGAFAVSLYPNSTFAPSSGTTGTFWKFVICSAAVYPAGASFAWLGTYQQCYSSLVTVVSSGDYSAAVSAGAPAVYYQDNKTGVAYFSSSSGTTNLAGGSAGAQPYQTAANTTAFVYPTTSKATFYVDGTRTDAYTADGTIERPFKTMDAAGAALAALVTAGGTGPYALWVGPASYTSSAAVSLPAVPLVIYGNSATWTGAAGITANGPTVIYDLNTVGNVVHAYTGTTRSERHGGSYATGNLTISGFEHWYGVQLTNTGGLYSVTVNGTLAGDFITGGMQILSGGPSAFIALNNINLQKASGYNFDMTAGGILAVNGGYLTTAAGTANIYLPTANALATSHAVQNLTFVSGTGLSAGSSTYYVYDNLSIDPVGALGYSFYRSGLTANHPNTTQYSGSFNVSTGSQTVYRCTTAGTLPIGALTTVTGTCGASTAAGVVVK